MLRKITSLLLPPQRFFQRTTVPLFTHRGSKVEDIGCQGAPITNFVLEPLDSRFKSGGNRRILHASPQFHFLRTTTEIIFPLICAGQTEPKRFSYEFNVVYIPCNSAQGRNVPREEEGGRGNKRNFPAGKQKEAII